MATILVTGGAGYIGSHTCKALRSAGHLPVVYDNLVTGWADAVRFGPFEQGDLQDRDRLAEVFARHRPEAVMHFAALSQVGESVEQPERYWRNNVCGSLNLIEATVAAGCRHFLFASTCAVYGDKGGANLDESSPLAPISPYAATKRAVEQMLEDFRRSRGLEHVVFRFFNVAGADPDAEIGEYHRPETHLIPIVLDAAAGTRPAIHINGTDYPTPDGTCLRDYVHVCDLADAHLAGFDWLRAGKGSRLFNLGTGQGYSVREVVEAVGIVTGKHVPVIEGPPRQGDAARLVSGGVRAADELGWTPHRSGLQAMIGDAWRWHQCGHYEK